MFAQQLKLYFKSKLNIIIVLAFAVIVLLSYFESFQSVQSLRSSLDTGLASEEIVAIQGVIDGTSGVSFFINFLFSSDYLVLAVLILGVGTCSVSSITNTAHLQSGYGSLIVARSGYRKYLRNITFAQIIYNFTFIFLLLILSGGISTVIAPPAANATLNININIRERAAGFICFITILQCMFISLYVVLTNQLTALFCLYTSNKFIIPIIPVLLFFLPFLAAVFLGNTGVMSFLTYVAPSSFILCIERFFSTNAASSERVASAALLPAILFLCISLHYCLCVKRLGNDYL